MKTEEALKILEKKLKEFKGDFSLTDAAAITGLSIDQAREALDRMMEKYECRLRATDQGDLIYAFGIHPKRRGEKSLKEILSDVAAVLWKAFTVLFKIWIAVTLVVYFVIFLILLVALMVLAASRGDSRRSPVKLDSIFRMFAAIFRWRTATSTIGYRTGRDGYTYPRYEPRPAVLNAEKKNFIASVYDFVFGPPRVNLDPLTNEKEVAAYLRKSKGIITPGEMVLLAGMAFEKADTFFSECLSRFKGDPVITEEGVVYGRFDELLRGTGQHQDGQIIYYWDEYEPEYELTGNTAGRNGGIFFMNLFNLSFALYILFGTGKFFAYLNPELMSLIQLVLGWLPLIFSLLFFAVPVGRWFYIRQLRHQREEANIRKRIMRYLFQKPDFSATIDEVLKAVNTPGTDAKLSITAKNQLTREQLEQAINAMMRDYQGEVTLTPEGKAVYVFQRLQRELAVAQAVRSTMKESNEPGRVIYDSGS